MSNQCILYTRLRRNCERPLALCLLFLLCLAPAQASVRRDIQRQYNRFARAYVRHDVKTMLSVLAPDYTLVNNAGETMTRSAYQETLLKRKAERKKTSAYRTRILSLKVTRNQAVVNTQEISKGVTQDPKTRRRRRTVHIHLYRDTWTRLRGGWRLQRTEAQGETQE